MACRSASLMDSVDMRWLFSIGATDKANIMFVANVWPEDCVTPGAPADVEGRGGSIEELVMGC